MREDFLPFAIPSIDEAEMAEVVDTLKSGWISTGPKVKQFEEAVAGYCGASHAVAVSSCTAGLHLSLAALGIGPGDEVIVPTMTFCATANVVEHLGARPVLVDVGDDYNIDIDSARAAITDRTRAIVPVHFAGQAVDLEGVFTLARAHDLAVVEDAAHAIGSTYRSMRIGADEIASQFSDLRRTVVFSFYATKNITTGEGGMVLTSDQGLAEEIRLLSLHGMSRDAWKRYTSAGSWFYEVVTPGYKANMTDLQAAIGLHQLAKLDGFIEARQAQAERYDAAFGAVGELGIPRRLGLRNHVFHIYVLRVVDGALTIGRNEFIDELRARNIGTSVHFIPVHTHPFYRDAYGHEPADLPNAARLFEEIVSLPLYPGLSEQDQLYVIDTITELVAMKAVDSAGTG